jgi:4-hydroxybenzoate polyprenyltransferase
MKILFHIYLNRFFHLGICLVLFTLFQYRFLGLEEDWHYLLLVLFSTVFIYNLHTLKRNDYHVSFEVQKITIYISLLALVGIAFINSSKTILYLIPAALISIFYVLPLLPGRKKLKEIGYYKILFLVLTLTYITVSLPLVLMNTKPFVLLLITVSRFLFLFVLALLFDIKDMQKDVSEGIKTIPSLLGIKHSLILSGLLLMIAFFLDFYMVFEFIVLMPYFLAMGFTYMIFFIFIFLSPKINHSKMYPFLADGLLALPYCFLYLI